MLLNASGYPLFAGVEAADDLLMTTMEELDKEVVNELTIQHPLWEIYKENGWIEYKSTIGPFISVKLMDKPNSTVKDFTHYDDVDMTPQEALTQAVFQYGHTVGTQTYSREELVKNQNNIVDLVQVMQDQLETSMVNHFADKVMGTQDSDGRSVMGFGRIMAYDQTLGGIDPTKPGFGYWNPQRGLKPTNAQYALATEMRAGMRRLVRLCTYKKESPKIWLMGEDLYDAMQSFVEDKVRVTVDDLKKKDLGSSLEDFELFKHNGRYYVYDESLPAKTGWLINPKRAPIRIHSGTNFTFEPWKVIPGKVAKYRECLLYSAIYCRRRNVHGFIEFT